MGKTRRHFPTKRESYPNNPPVIMTILVMAHTTSPTLKLGTGASGNGPINRNPVAINRKGIRADPTWNSELKVPGLALLLQFDSTACIFTDFQTETVRAGSNR